MTNKKKLVDIINSDYDKKNNYDLIINKMNYKNTYLYKLALIPICLIIIFLFTLSNNKTLDNKSNVFINDKSKTFQDETYLNLSNYSNYSNKDSLYIPLFDFEKNLIIPEDFDNKEYKEVIYTNNTNTSSSSMDYIEDKNNKYYKFHYFNSKNKRYILIVFSNDESNIFNHSNRSIDDKKSIINNEEIYIYKNENKYYTSFKYNDLYFYIQSIDINENEFIDLLKSIIK